MMVVMDEDGGSQGECAKNERILHFKKGNVSRHKKSIQVFGVPVTLNCAFHASLY
jgi:hypothetical protein